MVEVAGTWDFGWSAPKTEFEQWWAVMRSYEIPMLHMTPRSGMQDKLLTEHDSWESLLAEVSLTPVFVDENAECELADFVHPENVLYVFGKANYAPFATHGKGYSGVRIDCPKTGMLWPHQCVPLIMRDREQKT